MKKIIILLIIVVSIILIKQVYAAECGSTPTTHCTISSNTIFNPGTYNVANITVNSNSVTLDCNGAVLTGVGIGYIGIAIQNKQFITIKNCELTNYDHAISTCPEDCGKISNSIISNNYLHDNEFGVVIGQVSGNNYSNSNQIKNNNFINIQRDAIHFEKGKFNLISYNNIKNGGSGTSNGIRLMTGQFSYITNNLIENVWDAGIQLDTFSQNNTLSSNFIKNVVNDGIKLEGSSVVNNYLLDNTLFNNTQKGINLHWSPLNIVLGNSIIKSTKGIDINSNQNYIINNNFINNTQQVNSTGATNYYYTSLQSGNYWSNYNGPDNDLNGIGDVPYIINIGNSDSLPLMHPRLLSGPNVISEIGTTPAGESFNLTINDYLSANKPYLVLASFSQTPPIQLAPPDNRYLYLAADSLFYFTFFNPNNIYFQNTYGILDNYGRATATITIPNIPSLSGMNLYFAVIVFDPTALSGIARISHTQKITIT